MNMFISEIKNLICEYRYDGSDETFEIGGTSVRYLEGKMLKFTECGKGVNYKIYAVIKEGHNEPPCQDEYV